WLEDEIVIAHPPNGGVKVICDQFENGFCDHKSRACYVLERALENPDISHAKTREKEVQKEDEYEDDEDDEDEYEDDEDDDDGGDGDEYE
ncbi:MAG: hypothetical protein KC457_17490, partial [Myxococcales bacterium]|nr:hypothetical protein [Myxococcales bacterium]